MRPPIRSSSSSACPHGSIKKSKNCITHDWTRCCCRQDQRPPDAQDAPKKRCQIWLSHRSHCSGASSWAKLRYLKFMCTSVSFFFFCYENFGKIHTEKMCKHAQLWHTLYVDHSFLYRYNSSIPQPRDLIDLQDISKIGNNLWVLLRFAARYVGLRQATHVQAAPWRVFILVREALMMMPSLTLTQRLSTVTGYCCVPPNPMPGCPCVFHSVSDCATVWKLSKTDAGQLWLFGLFRFMWAWFSATLTNAQLYVCNMIIMTMRPNDELWLELCYLNFTRWLESPELRAN